MRMLADFNSKWSHPEDAPEPVDAKALDQAEAALGSRLPATYRAAILQVRLPRPTASLLRSVAEAALDLPDLSEFLSPAEMVSATQAWRGMGLPEHLVAFAADSLGNLFAFDGSDPAGKSEVWFFDHDERHIRSLPPSFEAWLVRYLQLTFVSFEDDVD